MLLVDTSIWIDHIRASNPRLVSLLEAEMVSMHPWIVGELATGNLADRAATFFLLRSLPQVQMASDEEVLFFIEKNHISGKGIGYVDAGILASAALGSLKVWTLDRRLREVGAGLALIA